MWRSRTFCWFAVAYSLVLTLAVVIVAVLLMRRSEARVQEAIASSLLDKSILVREVVAHGHLDANHLQERTQELGRETRTRITLIRAEGSVLADSASDPHGMANHRGRPEVEEAWTHGSG